MSILIKNMEMPTSCYECPCNKDDGFGFFTCGVTKSECDFRNLPSDCPLIEVPPHGRLIDADALMGMCGMAIDCYDCPNGEHGWCKRSQDAANICEAIEDAPTIIEAEEGE